MWYGDTHHRTVEKCLLIDIFLYCLYCQCWKSQFTSLRFVFLVLVRDNSVRCHFQMKEKIMWLLLVFSSQNDQKAVMNACSYFVYIICSSVVIHRFKIEMIPIVSLSISLSPILELHIYWITNLGVNVALKKTQTNSKHNNWVVYYVHYYSIISQCFWTLKCAWSEGVDQFSIFHQV